MHEELDSVRLRTGETLRVLAVQAPDAEHAGTVFGLLKHKGELRQWQFREDFAGRAAGVRSRYYLGFLDGVAVANVSVWETGPVGDLGHVFTAEAHRRKGVCRAVMGAQMEDFRRRGGELLVLGTGYGRPPYYIYQSFGFESMTPGSGYMRYQRDPEVFARLFAPAPVSVGPLAWGDLGFANALLACPVGNWLRSVRAHCHGPACYESAFVEDVRQAQAGTRQVQVARTPSGAVVAYAVLGPDPIWGERCWLLDVFVHPAFVACVPELLAGFCWPAAPVQCLVDADSPVEAALQQAGFAAEARLAGRLARGEQPLDVTVLRRS